MGFGQNFEKYVFGLKTCLTLSLFYIVRSKTGQLTDFTKKVGLSEKIPIFESLIETMALFEAVLSHSKSYIIARRSTRWFYSTSENPYFF